jgi:ribonucleoside-diphosphate reductase alpha chain
LGVLDVSHPDIADVIAAKSIDRTALSNFNLSVAVPDRFLNSLRSGSNLSLINPWTGARCDNVCGKDLRRRICWRPRAG